MSTTIESKVIELRFDNRNFEKNVNETIQSLDKLQSSTNFDKSVKSLENLDKASEEVDFKGMTNSVETVTAKFSAMDVIAVTALSNITNKVVNLGEKMVKSLTIDNISAGWSKYEQKTASVQTLVNSTGLSVQEINEYLDQLMWFSDETSYSFTDMVSSLSQMTTAGGDIKKLIPMITGVANATAFAGKGAAEFSRSIYNLNQSYSHGALTAIDWKSFQLAGTSSKQLTEALIRAGEELGTIKKDTITVANFQETLKDNWATTAVMEKAFGEFSSFSNAAYEFIQEANIDNVEITTSEIMEHFQLLKNEGVEAVKALKKATDGNPLYTDEQIELMKKYNDRIGEMGIKAFTAAQSAKSFKEAVDATKDALGTQFMRIFEAVFGDYDKARKLWTDVANTFYDIFVAPISKMADFIEKLMSKSPLKPIFDSLTKLDDLVKKVTKTEEEYQQVANDIINKPNFAGYGTEWERWNKLEEAGYEWQHTQNIINEKVGVSLRRESEYEKALQDGTKAQEGMTEVTKKRLKELIKLNEEQLRAQGLTEEQIDSIKELRKWADKIGFGNELEYFIDMLDEINGRFLLIEGFAHIGNAIATLFNSIKDAFMNVFFPKDEADQRLETVFNLLAGFHKIAKTIDDFVKKQAEPLERIFTAIFSVIKVITTYLSIPFKLAWEVVKGIFQGLGIAIDTVLEPLATVADWLTDICNILINNPIVNGIKQVVNGLGYFIGKTLSAIYTSEPFKNALMAIFGALNNVWQAIKQVGKVIYDTLLKGLVKWFEENKILEKSIEFVADCIIVLIEGIGRFIKGVREFIVNHTDLIRIFTDFGKKIKENGIAIWEWIKGLSKAENLGKYILDGLINGLKGGLGDVLDFIINIGKEIIDIFAKTLGIHSPSKVFMIFGGFIIAGLIAGLKGGFGNLTSTMFNFGGDTISAFFNGILGVIPKGIGGLFDILGAIISKIKDFLSGIDIGTLLAFSAAFVGIFTVFKLMNIADKVVSPLARFNDTLEIFNKNLNGMMKAIKVKIYAAAFENIAKGLAIIAGAIVALALLDTGKLWSAVGALAAMITLIGIFVAVCLLITKSSATTKDAAKDALKLGQVVGAMIGLAFAMILMAIAFKKVANLSFDKWIQGIIGIGLLIGAMIAVLKIAQKFEKDITKGTYLIYRIAGALLSVGVACLLISMVSWEGIKKAATVMAIFGVFIIALMAVSKLLDKNSQYMTSFATGMAKIGSAMILMAIALKIIGSMDWTDLSQGLVGMGLMVGFIVGLMAMTKLLDANSGYFDSFSKNMVKIGGCLLLMSLSMRILASMDWTDLAQGIVGLVVFGGFIVGLMAATKLLNSKEKSIDKASKLLLKVAGLIAVMTLCSILLGMIEIPNLAKGIVAIGILSAIAAGLVYVTKFAGNGKNTAQILKMLAINIAVMAVALAVLSMIDPARLIVSAVSLGMVISALALAIAMTGKAANKKGVAAVAIMAIIIAELGATLVLLGNLPVDRTLAAAGALSAVLLVLAAAMTIAMKSIKKKALGSIIVMAVIIAELGAVLVLLSMMPIDNSLAAAAALSAVLLAFAGAMTILSKSMGKNSKKMLVGLIGMTLVIAAMGALVWLLTSVPATDAAVSVGALVLLMAGLAVFVLAVDKIGSKIKTSNMTKSLLSIAVIVGCLYIVALAVKEMSGIKDLDKVINALCAFMVGLGVALIAVAAAGAIFTATGGTGLLMALAGIAAIVAAIVVVLAALVGVAAAIKLLDLNEDDLKALDGIMTFAIGISEVLLKLSLVAPLLAIAVVALAGLLIVITGFAALATALGALSPLKGMIESGVEIILILVKGVSEALKIMSKAFGQMLIQLGKDLAEFGIHFSAFAAIMAVMPVKRVLEGVGVVAASVVALTASALINGIRKLLSMFTGGTFSLTTLADDLSDFAVHLTGPNGFLTIMSNVPTGVAQGVDAISSAFLKLTAGAFLNGLLNLFSFFTGDAFSLEQFGKDISTLGTALNSFITGFLGADMTKMLESLSGEGADPQAAEKLEAYTNLQVKVVEAASEAIKKLAEAQEALPRRGGWKTTFSGSVQTLNEFAEGFKGLGKSLTEFSGELIKNGFDDDDIRAVEVAAEAIKDLSQAAGELPNDGTGIVADWTGRTQSLEAFSDQFPLVAGNLVKFAQALTTVVDPDTGKVSQYDWSSDVSNAVTTASQAIKAMADATSFLNSTGTKVTTTHHDKWWDFLDWFPTKEEVKYIDSLDITSFTNTFPIIAKALKDFTSVLSGENDLIYNQDKGKIYWYKLTEAKEGMKLNVDTIKDIVPIYSNMLSAITDFAKESKTQFGFGDSDLQTAVGNLEKIGPILTTLITEFEKDNYNVDNIDEFRSRIQNAGAILTEFNKSFDFKQTSSTIAQLSSNILLFNNSYKTPDFKNITNTLDAIKNFVDISLPKYDSTHMVEELNKIGVLFDTFKNNLTSESYKPLKDFLDGFANIGKDALAKLQSGFCDKITSNNSYRSLASALSNFFTSIRGEAEKDRTESATSLKAKGEEIGKDLLRGLEIGLKNETLLKSIYKAAFNVSHKYAVSGLKDGSNEQSPSKDAMKIGRYLDEGLIIGINELKDRVYNSSFGIGKVATSGLSNSISRIADVVDSDIDVNPTIAPVLDLSDVQAGVGYINSAFNNLQQTVGLGMIGANVDAKIQNGNDLGSSIDQLRKSLSGATGTTNNYNINGVTYDDGSNIHDAVETLVRAVNLERRV
jgi:hypothetical protein